MTRSLRVLLPLLLVLVSATAFAQLTTGTLLGTVVDNQGSALPAASTTPSTK